MLLDTRREQKPNPTYIVFLRIQMFDPRSVLRRFYQYDLFVKLPYFFHFVIMDLDFSREKSDYWIVIVMLL